MFTAGNGHGNDSGPVWLSITVEGEVFDEADRPALQPLTDWRIVVSPPLILENTLPISGSYIVWERPEVLHTNCSAEAQRLLAAVATCSQHLKPLVSFVISIVGGSTSRLNHQHKAKLEHPVASCDPAGGC